MCIIFYATKKQGIPDDATLDRIFRSNPDGGGVAHVYTDETTGTKYVAYEKGLMTLDPFKQAVKTAFDALVKDDDYVVAHTRIATSGTRTPEMTHPFAITSDNTTAMLLFHNGIFSKYDKLDGNDSDTAWLAKHYVDKEWLLKLDNTSKYFIINYDGSFDKLGIWTEDAQGRSWSNYGYIAYSYTKYNGYGYKGSTYWYPPYNHGPASCEADTLSDFLLASIIKQSNPSVYMTIKKYYSMFQLTVSNYTSKLLFYHNGHNIELFAPFGTDGYLGTMGHMFTKDEVKAVKTSKRAYFVIPFATQYALESVWKNNADDMYALTTMGLIYRLFAGNDEDPLIYYGQTAPTKNGWLHLISDKSDNPLFIRRDKAKEIKDQLTAMFDLYHFNYKIKITKRAFIVEENPTQIAEKPATTSGLLHTAVELKETIEAAIDYSIDPYDRPNNVNATADMLIEGNIWVADNGISLVFKDTSPAMWNIRIHLDVGSVRMKEPIEKIFTLLDTASVSTVVMDIIDWARLMVRTYNDVFTFEEGA